MRPTSHAAPIRASVLGLVLFLLHPAAILLKPDLPVLDPGCGWHVTCGRIMLQTGHLIRHDPFSFSEAGRPWLMNDWLFFLLLGALDRIGGLPLIAAASALVYGMIPFLLYRRMLREGSGVAPSFVSALLAYFVLMMHGMARPHIFTYLFLAALLDALDRIAGGEPAGKRPLWVGLMMLFWVNLHGGFAVGLVACGIYLAAAASRHALLRPTNGGRIARDLFAICTAAGLASLANPHGWNYHLSILTYLGRDSVRLWQEWRPPSFSDGGSSVYAFEAMVVLLLLVAGFSRRLFRLHDAALIGFLLHSALHSLRHVNLFAIAAAPALARGFTQISNRLCGGRPPHAWLAPDPCGARPAIWAVAIASAIYLALAPQPPAALRRDLHGIWLSRGASDFIASNIGRFGRTFNTDDVGGTLIYNFWPGLRVFMDDRDFYSERFVAEEYFPIRFGRDGWRAVVERWDFTAAVINRTAPTAPLFQDLPGWRRAYEDDKVVIFLRDQTPDV